MKLRKETKRIIIHHSASPRDVLLEQIRVWHVKDRGYEDIGYHMVIEGDGRVRRARDIHLQGAHAGGANHDSIGICVVGDNTRADRAWTPPQITSLRELVHQIQAVYGPLVVCGHRDAKGGTTPTECPGIEIQSVL